MIKMNWLLAGFIKNVLNIYTRKWQMLKIAWRLHKDKKSETFAIESILLNLMHFRVHVNDNGKTISLYLSLPLSSHLNFKFPCDR
jgi:hypothetical protein